MGEGRILAARRDGAYVIRLVGDVRLTLCTTIDEYFCEMYEDPVFVSVLVDLCEAEGIDSTTLGLLAKLAITVKKRFGFMPVIYSSDSGINRLLRSMGFQGLFEIRESVCEETVAGQEIPHVEGTEAAVKEKIVEAHRILMGLSDENKARFQDLMTVLERS